jgi:hypothetical protein
MKEGEMLPRPLKKSSSQAASDQPKASIKPLSDLETVAPNLLRERLLKALWNLPPEEQLAFRDRLLTCLEHAGINIGVVLFLLGIFARTPDELTPTDLANLIRCVRYSSPRTMQVLAAPLSELLAARDELKNGARHSRLAA